MMRGILDFADEKPEVERQRQNDKETEYDLLGIHACPQLPMNLVVASQLKHVARPA
jgi:hypothetical protein